MNVCQIKCETKKKYTKTKPGFSLCNITVVPKINLKLLCVSTALLRSPYVAVLKKINNMFVALMCIKLSSIDHFSLRICMQPFYIKKKSIEYIT